MSLEICFVQEAAPEEDEDEWDDQGREDLKEGGQAEASNNPERNEDLEAGENQEDEQQGNTYIPETAILEPLPHDTEVAANAGKEAPHSQGHGSDPGHQNEHQVGTEAKTRTDQPTEEKVEEEKPLLASSVLVALHKFWKSQH